MKTNISLEEMFGDRLREMRERDKEFLPETSWFSSMDVNKLDTYMTKYPFDSFESIPEDHSGLVYPAFEDITFTLPPLYKSCSTKIVYVDGLSFLKNLGNEAFCIDPRRWHRIKTYVSKGQVEYPQALSKDFGVSDGRHRTLLLMQIYKRRTIPVAIEESRFEKFLSDAKKLDAI